MEVSCTIATRQSVPDGVYKTNSIEGHVLGDSSKLDPCRTVPVD